MTIIDNEMLWRQFGAAIDMLGDALRDCLADQNLQNCRLPQRSPDPRRSPRTGWGDRLVLSKRRYHVPPNSRWGINGRIERYVGFISRSGFL